MIDISERMPAGGGRTIGIRAVAFLEFEAEVECDRRLHRKLLEMDGDELYQWLTDRELIGREAIVGLDQLHIDDFDGGER